MKGSDFIINENDVKQIVSDNTFKICGAGSGPLMPEQIMKIMAKSIYDSIKKYDESVTTNNRR